VEKRPERPSTVDVELYPETDVNGKTDAARVEVDMVLTCPAEPKYVNPCERDGRYREEEIVEDAVEKNPLVRPRVVDVELYPETDVNGKLTVSAPETSERPVPVRSLNDSPLTIRFVVDADVNEAYVVEE
jgi:hypothetical protein